MGVASKPTRNGYVHLMHGLLIALANLSNPMVCEDSIKIIDNMLPSLQHRAELVEIIKMNTEEGCEWDAKAD